jgi:hypothetical protein
MARTLIELALIIAASMTPVSVPLLTETAAGPTARGAAARAFTDELVGDLVRDLDAELEMGWRTPSMERFRDRLVGSSGVIDTVLMLGRILSSGELLDRAVRPSPIRESALRVIVRIACHRQAVAAAELSAVVIPDGPDRYEEFQPRPQRGGAVGGTFSEFHSEEERAEYERNAALLQRRLQFKVLRTRLELELKTPSGSSAT